MGCLYIAYLGVQILKQIYGLKPNAEAPSQEKSLEGGFKQGFLVGISNPKDIIFFASFFPQFIHITPDLNMSLGILTLS